MSIIIKKVTLQVCSSECQSELGAVLTKWIENIESGNIKIDDPNGAKAIAKELFDNTKLEHDNTNGC